MKSLQQAFPFVDNPKPKAAAPLRYKHTHVAIETRFVSSDPQKIHCRTSSISTHMITTRLFSRLRSFCVDSDIINVTYLKVLDPYLIGYTL